MSLVEVIKSSSFINRVRNQLNIRPSYANMANAGHFNFYSDLFPWRQDKGFTTNFRLSNPFALYETTNSVKVALNIFNRNGALIDKRVFETKDKSISLDLQEFL